ncbi:hypothetical protein CUMW_273360 [Citrus unshiu]|uniref:Uncharacterized protein n=1 Tax=Citrus unshiu TaxID=55188 RepID=A0A2H5MXG2_CITUN|nr:hypothetical protein CUMW_273360 [Citrus unshiu]
MRLKMETCISWRSFCLFVRNLLKM